jgi:hypothetical protein
MPAEAGEAQQGELQGVLASAASLDRRPAHRHHGVFLEQTGVHRRRLVRATLYLTAKP